MDSDEHSPHEEEEEQEEEKEEKEEGEEEEEEKEEVPEPCPLTEEVLKEGLSLLSKTGNGLAHTYVKFVARGKDLTDISLLKSFIHLRYVDLSENKLQDLSPLSSLTELLWLKMDGNLLNSACMEEMSYLQVISFDRNRIKDMEGISHPRLATLSLKENKIQTMLGLSQDQLFNLQVLELRGNKLKSTAGLSLPKLKKLYLEHICRLLLLPQEQKRLLDSRFTPQDKQLTGRCLNYADYAQTDIGSLEGLEGLEQLETLHLRDNKFETLDGFSSSMKCLQYLNLRNNGISSFQEVEKLQVLPVLQTLVLLDNPCADEPDYRLEVLALLPHLQRLDKEAVEEDEQEEAMRLRQTRQEEKEKEMEEPQNDVTE